MAKSRKKDGRDVVRVDEREAKLATSRRKFLQAGAAASFGFLVLNWQGQRQVWAVPIPGGTLDPTLVPKYQAPMVIPPAMPNANALLAPPDDDDDDEHDDLDEDHDDEDDDHEDGHDGRHKEKKKEEKKKKEKDRLPFDYYEIGVREFQQQILPPGMPSTTVWSYGSLLFPGTVGQGGTFNYPAFTIEARNNRPTRVRWSNDLVDGAGNFLPHLLPVDQTLHWANPVGPRDARGSDPTNYVGPVPIVTHVHGAHTTQESDGYPEAWYLPAAANLPTGYSTTGTYYDLYQQTSPLGAAWAPGSSVFEYPNTQRATTLWYHDHTLGMTRVNVYAGPAGFYLIRGGADDKVTTVRGKKAKLPGPAPAVGDAPGTDYYELPIVVQDRSFNADGSLFYPDQRAFFEGLDSSQLQIPFIPDPACNGEPSDVSPIWQPEFFGNVMVVNGVAWPFQTVEQRRYRLRLLNGCNSRFVILKIDDPAVQVWQIGADGGFLSAPVDTNATSGGMILMAPAERVDVIVDFTNVAAGATIQMSNYGPDEPFGGGLPGVDFPAADAASTGQVMQFQVVPAKSRDRSTPPAELVLPAIVPPDPNAPVRIVTLNEEVSKTVNVVTDGAGNIVLACDDPAAEPFGPTSAILGDATGGLLWNDPVTEAPVAGSTETWEIHNLTADAHPIHIHLVQFQVVNREVMGGGAIRPPEPGESGYKDTVISYPGEITRVQARFDIAGRYVWHCHIVEHEDNEMMRPYDVI